MEKNANPRIVIVIFVCAITCFLSACFAQAQESWGSPASAWHAGAAPPRAAATRTAASGPGSGWSAGKETVPSQRQAGGVWHDGSTLSASTSGMSAKYLTSGSRPLSKPVGLAPLPRVGHGGTSSGKSHVSRSPNGPAGLNRAGSQISQRSGIRNGITGSAHGSRARSAAAGRHGQSASSGRKGTKDSSSRSGTSTQGDTTLRSLTGTGNSQPTDSFGLERPSASSELKSPLGQTPR